MINLRLILDSIPFENVDLIWLCQHWNKSPQLVRLIVRAAELELGFSLPAVRNAVAQGRLFVHFGVNGFFALDYDARRSPNHQSVSVSPIRTLTCQGSYWHGKTYNGVPFICAIHPSGYNGNTCPDHS